MLGGYGREVDAFCRGARRPLLVSGASLMLVAGAAAVMAGLPTEPSPGPPSAPDAASTDTAAELEYGYGES